MTPATIETKRKTAGDDKVAAAGHYVCKHGDDMPEISGWRWGRREKAGGPSVSDTAGDNV